MMRQGPELRGEAKKARLGRLPPAFWLAQGLIGLALVVVSFRTRADAAAAPPVLKKSHEKTAQASPSADPVPPPASPAAAAPTFRHKHGGLRGAPYDWEGYRSDIRVVEDQIQWTLDPRELDWLLANRREVLARDLQTDPEPEGGLRVRAMREGSFGEHRGIRVGDVLLDINGRDLDSPSDLEDFLGNPGYSGAGGWRVRLRRGQEVLLLDYRSAS